MSGGPENDLAAMRVEIDTLRALVGPLVRTARALGSTENGPLRKTLAELIEKTGAPIDEWGNPRKAGKKR